MIAKVLSYALLGLEGVPVAVETDISPGFLPLKWWDCPTPP